MNAWQFFKQFKYELDLATWTGGKRVFPSGSIVVCADVPEEFLSRTRLPCALIRVQDAPADPEHDEEPDLFGQTFDVTVAVAVANDPFGEAAFLGGGRADANASPGKGLLEMEEKLWEAVKGLGETHGIRVQSRGKGAAGGLKHSELGYIAWRSYRFTADLGAVRFYHPGTNFAVTTGGVASWALPADRFDYRRMVLRRAAGATAPTSITGGTGVVLGGVPDGVAATGVNDAPGSGVFSYALFAVYDEYATDSDAQVSEAATVTVTIP